MSVLTHPLSLKALHYSAMARGFLRYRNPYRRSAWKHRVAFYDRAWKEAADELGATWRPLGNGILQITRDGAQTLVRDNASAVDDPVTLDLLSDKAATYRLLQEHDLAVPRYAEFSLKAFDKGAAFVRESPGGCVVKPVRGTGGGRGITSGVQKVSHLAQAAAVASIYCDDLLIEEQVEGDNYRLLYFDGELIDAFVRRAPTVVGDGRSTIAALVRQANARRVESKAAISQVLLTIDLDMRRTLARQARSLKTIPAAGEVVTLKTVVNENRGDDNVTAMGALCPSIVEAGAAAARATGIRLGGVDMILKNPTLPLREQGGVILEVNAPPNFYYHYHKRDGCFPVAVHVLGRLLEEASGNLEKIKCLQRLDAWRS